MAISMTQRLRYEGRMEGRTEGRMEGCIGTWHKSILSLLTKRLGVVPAMIRERILDMHDEIALESLFQEALLCQSWEEFQDSLL